MSHQKNQLDKQFVPIATEDDRIEIATEGGKDSRNVRGPHANETPKEFVNPVPQPPAPKQMSQPMNPQLGDGGEDAFAGQPREKGGER